MELSVQNRHGRSSFVTPVVTGEGVIILVESVDLPTLKVGEQMLPGFIIDQIRQREEEEQAKRPSPQIELHLPVPEGSKAPECDEESDRGVVIIDLLPE